MTLWHGFLSLLLVIPAPAGRLNGDANRFVADALAAEATWRGFPGFVANLEIKCNGKVGHGRVVVQESGRLFVEHVPEVHRAWAAQHLGSVIRQRLRKDGMTDKTWMFVKLRDDRDPLGQAVYRTDAPFDSCLWILDQRVHAVETRCCEHKQRLTTLKTERNADKKHLPVVQVLHRWDARTSKLEATETTLITWQRVACFDLPASIQVLSVGVAGEPAITRIVLTRHQLFESPDRLLANR